MERALILLHGTRMSQRQWRPYEDLLSGLPLMTRDLPGHGERAGEEFTRDAALATVDEAVQEARELGDGRPVLAGHSLGGYLGAMWAAQHPRGLGALVLIGATADPAGPLTGVYRGFARALPYVQPERMAAAMNVIFRRLGATGEHADLLPDGAGYAALPAAWQLVMDECGPDLLREVDCPVWMVNGQLDQMRIHVRRFAEAAADARVVTVPRATHLMPATHPEQVAAVLRAAVAQAR